jgi:predicted HD superfamily hydrolase involved in NAD metabolism
MDYINDRQKLLNLLKENLSEEKYAHSLGVENTAMDLARVFGADEQKAGFAGLVHDVTKEMDNIRLAAEYSIEKYVSPKTLHAYTGAVYLQKNHITQDEDILAAVKYHTTGREAMSVLEKIIYLADLIEPGRVYPAAMKIKPLCYENLDLAMFLSLKMTIKFILKHNMPIDLNTVSAYNYYSRAAAEQSRNGGKEWK